MQVTATNSATASAATTAAAGAPTLGYNQFLQLLIAQLKNQDPTAPTDSTQFVSQLASFSSVEQSVQANAKLAQILTASSLEQAASMVGRTLTSADGTQSGVVASVATATDGLTATFTDGTTMAITSGVRVS